MTGATPWRIREERMTPPRILLIALVVLAVHAMSAGAAVNFVYPGPHSWVNRAGHVIMKLNQPDLTTIRVTVNGLASDPLDVGSPEYRRLFQDFFIAEALWDRGVNKLQVDLFRGGQKVETAATEIFLTDPERKGSAPPDFAANTMHVPEREVMCVSCHNLKPTRAQMNSTQERVNPCMGCHGKMLNVKYVHGPVGTNSCGYCHTSEGNPKHGVPRRGSALCFECHADMAKAMQKLAFVHGPVEAGLCEACHDPHGSQNESQLIKPINELCLSCHGHIRNQIHVVRTPEGKGHILSGKPNPAKMGSGREMSCIACHNPHGGAVRYYFVSNSEDRMTLCQMCHNK